MAFFRSYDASIGRFMQVDPKYTYSQSVYSGLGNNPILYSDPLGDTTRVYGMDGVLMGTINDSRANQEHFIADDQVDNISHLLEEHSAGVFDADEAANGVRKNSAAFIGANTRSDLKSLAETGEADGVEAYGVAVISDSREIRIVDKSGDLDIAKGAKPGSCNNCRSEAFVSIRPERAMKGINQSIIFDAHTHGDYSVKSKNQSLSVSSSGLLIPSNSDYKGSALQQHLKFSPSIISTKSGYRIYSTKFNYKSGKYENPGQNYSY